MMRKPSSRRTMIVIALVLCFATLWVAVIAVKPLPLMIWNASDSVPIGLYFVSKRQPKIGEIAVIGPTDWVRLYASSRGYLPENVWLLKPVFASSNRVVCRFGKYIFVGGILVAKAKTFDRNHRLLPVWKGCRALKSDEIFVLAKPSHSFDSRYFGPVNRGQIIGTAIHIKLH